MGNVLAVLFTHSRGAYFSVTSFTTYTLTQRSLVAVIQELGREGVLPYSSFFATNQPFNTPLGGLFAQWLVNCIVILAVPSGDAYVFILNSMHLPFFTL